MTPTTYGRDFAYCLKSHGGVRGFNASLWRFLLRCTLFCHSVATFLTSVSSYEGGCGFEGKIKDLRSDFQWGLAHQLCKQYDYIFIEDLNIEGMKRLWGKKVSDLSHSSFIDKLMYISSKYGVTIHKIDKWYPSSKTCECGCINKGLSLRDRTWVCPACGAVNDRDVLAARNILRKGISELESKSNSSDSNIGVSCVCIQESHLL